VRTVLKAHRKVVTAHTPDAGQDSVGDKSAARFGAPRGPATREIMKGTFQGRRIRTKHRKQPQEALPGLKESGQARSEAELFKLLFESLAWWYIPVISALWWWKQENLEFEVRLGYTCVQDQSELHIETLSQKKNN
jgi:hypothetical protein